MLHHHPLQNRLQCILKRSFLVALDVIASIIHLKMKHPNNSGESVIIVADLRLARLIHKMVLKDPFCGRHYL